MCGRYVVISKIIEIEARFNVHALGPYKPNYNIGPAALAPVITSAEPKTLQFFHFGFSPFWAKKRMYLFNARSEGDHNKDNNPLYVGARGIISKPAFRKAIRSQRCLVVADSFIEGTTKEKLSNPFVVHLSKGKRPFAFAGIWDEWVDQNSGEIFKTFAIITTTPNELLQKIPHHRSPVILSKSDERKWLDETLPLADITELLRPYAGDDMNAYPISDRIKNPRNNDIDLLRPVGPAVETKRNLVVEQEVVLEGMGFSRARGRNH